MARDRLDALPGSPRPSTFAFVSPDGPVIGRAATGADCSIPRTSPIRMARDAVHAPRSMMTARGRSTASGQATAPRPPATGVVTRPMPGGARAGLGSNDTKAGRTPTPRTSAKRPAPAKNGGLQRTSAGNAAPRPAPRIGHASAPLHVDPDAPHVDGEALLRAEQCVALLQRRLIKPMSRGGPRSELTLTQYHALSFLAARGQASVSELKDILGCAQSTTSVLVDKLARMGLVEKLRDRRDHRLACVVPLPKGLRMVQRYRKNAERNLLALRHHLGEAAVREVFDALERALVATAPLENPRVAAPLTDDDNDDEDTREAAE